MTRRPYDPAASPLRAPEPGFGRMLARAAGIALTAAIVAVLLYALFGLLASLRPPGDVGPGPAQAWLRGAGRLAVVIFVLVFSVTLPFLLRGWQDRAFHVVGLAATFFGLGMLLLFFTQLAADVQLYFQVTPVLVEQHNRELSEQVEQAEKTFAAELAETRQEMAEALAAAANAQEKREIRDLYEKEILPNRVKVLRENAAEKKLEAEMSQRPDTSGPALVGHFLTHGPSDKPQDVGVLPALLGSVWVALLTVLFAVPVGVGAALYLEEYRSNRWLGSIIQVNINNLAGIPSVVYGILGGFVFVELFFKPLALQYPGIAVRNVLGGGLTLGLLTLPVVIVAAQESIRAVPLSVRQGAYALGATRWQVTRYQVLPMALPGILTGTILALSRAIGEAAPLVLFGALQFVDQLPTPLSRFTVLPMQIFGWTERPPVEVTVAGTTHSIDLWRSNAALASVLLLVVLLSLNGLAIYLRNRAQRQTRA